MKNTAASIIIIRLSAIILAFSIILPLHAAPVRMLNYKDGSKSPVFRAEQFVQKMIRLADSALPYSQKSMFVTTMGNPEKIVSAKIRKYRKELIVRYPDDDRIIRSDLEMTTKLMCWFLLARLGEAPEKEPMIRGHWIVAALVRKALSDNPDQLFIPFPNSYPFALSLSANGYAPDPATIAGSEMEPENTVEYRFSSEYAELLYESCRANGFANTRFFAKLLLNALSDPFPDHRADILFQEGRQKLKPKSDRYGREDPRYETDQSIWFQRELEKLLLNCFTPASPEFLETLYHSASVYRFQKKSGDGKRMQTVEVRLRNFARERDLLPDGNAAVDEMIRRLNFLALIAPPGFSKEFGNLRLALSACRVSKPAKDADKALLEAEAALFEYFRNRMELDKWLQEKENRLISPGKRWALSFQALDELQNRKYAEFPKISNMLDKFDDCAAGGKIRR